MPGSAGLSMAQAKHVGLLVVHGIGQQQRFETAAALTRALAGTLGARELARALAGEGASTFDVIDRTADRKTGELDCPSPEASDSPLRNPRPRPPTAARPMSTFTKSGGPISAIPTR